MSAPTQLQRSVPQLYRDCMRLIRHVAPGQTSAKSVALRRMVGVEFRKPLANAGELDSRKANAMRALSNYMLTVSAPKDKHLNKQAKEYHEQSVQEAKEAEKHKENQPRQQ